MKVHFSIIVVLANILISTNTYAQADHLEPVGGVFDIYNHQFEYYPTVRKILFEDLSDSPDLRYLVMPSFSPEKVIDIEYSGAQGKTFIKYRIADKSIWYTKDKKQINVLKIDKEITRSSAKLIDSLFKKAISNTRFPEKEQYGLDGVNYYFAASNKSGKIWSPRGRTNMARLVEIGEQLIEFAQNDNQELDPNQLQSIESLLQDLP